MDASKIERTAVIGAGFMGAGFAQILAQAGCHVYMVGRKEESLNRCSQRVQKGLADFVGHGLLSEDQIIPIIARIEGTTSMKEAARDVQFVIEAVVEDLPVKQSVFEQLDRCAPREAILATNTSGLRLGDIAAQVRYKDRVVGSHFFTPHTVTPLVEVAYGEETSHETVQTTVAFWKRCGKEAVVCLKDVNGFIVNRLQQALCREAISIVQNGIATAKDVDKATRLGLGVRLPMVGMLEQRDWSGLDINLAAVTYIYPVLESSKVPLKIHVQKVTAGHTGVKAGKGFFDWTGTDIDALRARKQLEVIKLMQALTAIMPDKDDLVENPWTSDEEGRR